jgi:hypothetical protein
MNITTCSEENETFQITIVKFGVYLAIQKNIVIWIKYSVFTWKCSQWKLDKNCITKSFKVVKSN